MGSTSNSDLLPIRSVCVIGAGTMGSGIAAHLANLGFQVTLLDRSSEAVAEAFDRCKRARPPHFFVPETAARVRLGSIDQQLDLVRDADWVCEAIFENLEAKKSLFAQIEPLLRPEAMISTNTSGLQISLLAEGRSADFRRRFHGTHFFNPPRYLKLLELIPTEETDPAVITMMSQWLELACGRRVVVAKDTPGFIANRFGMWAMMHAVHTAEALQLSVEQVDAITGPFLGRPKSASFRLNDLVGLDIMQSISSNLYERCPDDPHRDTHLLPKSIQTLLDRGWIGDKAGQGYYRREGKEFFAYDLNTGAYRQRQDVEYSSIAELSKRPLGERIAAALELRDEVGEYLRSHLVPVLRYADYLKEEISHSVEDFDRVMMWGFGWQAGPFEMIDGIGASKLGLPEGPYFAGDQVRSFGGTMVPRKAEPEFRALVDYPVIDQHQTFNVRDLGDDVFGVGLTTKMGVIGTQALDDLTSFFRSAEGRYVLSSEARSFSAGFDLKFCLTKVQEDDWDSIEEALVKLQDLSVLLGSKRVVAAIYGHCLGAGLEVAMGCPLVAASAECQIGLPEAKVGLIPGGSGSARMHLRNQDSAKGLVDASLMMMQGTTASNADEAIKLGFLSPGDKVVYHPDMLITVAKKLALSVQPRSLPAWSMPEGPVAGMIDRGQQELKQRGTITDYDETIGDRLKTILAKSTSFDDALARERAEFRELCHHALTQARIRHMLDTGKPLRN